MPFTTEDFLDALNLPEEHPYVVDSDDLEPEQLKPWSVADYFGSVASKKSPSNHANECPKISSSSPWNDAKLTQCNAYAGNVDSYNNRALNADRVTFFQEIKPCLRSMCHMTILLWAPVILFLCMKRLTTPHRHHPRSTDTAKQFRHHNAKYCMVRTDMMRRSTVSKESQSSSTNQASMNENKAIGTSAMPFFANFISILSTSLPPFSIEDGTNKQYTAAEKHQKLFTKQHSSFSIGDCSQCTGTGDPLAYIIVLLVTSILMTDAMYILEFSQGALISLHVLIISIGLKRLGPKTALLIALPITTVSFLKMLQQDLDLPSIHPGLYYSKSNPIVSSAVQNYWPVESRTYNGGTPWILTGDTRTGLPFLMYTPPTVNYARRWIPIQDEKEALILDIAFPESNTIEDDKNVYLIIHGINGHSNEVSSVNIDYDQ